MGIIDWVVGKVKNAVTSLKNMFFAPEEEEVEEYLIDKSREVATTLEIDKKINALKQMRKAIENYSLTGLPSDDQLKMTYNSLEDKAIDALIENLKKEDVIIQAKIGLLNEIKKKRKKGKLMPLSDYAYLVEVGFRLTIVCKEGGTMTRMGDIKIIKKASSVAECEVIIHEALSDPPYHEGDTINELGKSCIIAKVEPIVGIKGMDIGSGTEIRKEEGLLRWTEDV